MNCGVSHVIVLNWATEYGNLMLAYADTIAPSVGEQWLTDEVYVTVRGNQRTCLRCWTSRQDGR